jgi:hypothetical protein
MGFDATSYTRGWSLSSLLSQVQLPFALLPILCFTSRRDIMGRFCNSPAQKIIGIFLFVVVIGVNGLLICQFLLDPDSPMPTGTTFTVAALLGGTAYAALIWRSGQVWAPARQ